MLRSRNNGCLQKSLQICQLCLQHSKDPVNQGLIFVYCTE